MTKREAVEKVCKLRRLADRAGTPAEAESARRAASKIMADHRLTSEDIAIEAKCAAFDDLLGRLEVFVATHPERSVPLSVIKDAVSRAKSGTKAEDKARALGAFVGGVRTAFMFASSSKTVIAAKEIVDEVLRAHDVTI